MRPFRAFVCALAVVAVGVTCRAEERFGVGLKLGTLGIGVEFTGQINGWCALRGTLNQYDYSKSFDNSGIQYDGKLKLGGYGVLADFYPTKGKFRLTAGLLANRNKVEMTANPTENINIGDGTYTPQQVGTLNGDLKYRSTVPYFGLGYGNAARGPHRVGFVFDVGVVAQGEPSVTLTSSTGQVPQSDLDKEAAQVQDDTKNTRFWPVIAFGISFRI